MTRRRVDDPVASQGDVCADRRLIERIGEAYTPAGLVPSARYALERDLWKRIECRRRPAWFRPALAMVTVFATVLWFARPPSDSDTVTMAEAVIDAWEYDVLYSDALDDSSFDWGGTAGLPEDVEDIEMLIGHDGPDEGKGT